MNSKKEKEQICAYVAAGNTHTVDLLMRMLANPTPNPPGDTRGLVDVIVEYIDGLPGVTYQRIVSDELIHNLIIRLEGKHPGRKLIINGHLDTFPIVDATITVDAGSPNILRFGEKGAIWMTVTAKSNSYHAAHTHLGTSAIEKLTDAMLDLRSLRNYPVNAPPNVLDAIDEVASAIGTTVNSGVTDVLKSVTVNFTVIKGGT